VYVESNYKYGNDTKWAIKSLTKTTLKLPAPPSVGADASERRVWEKEIDSFMREREQKEIDSFVRKKGLLQENLNTIYSLMWGQCTDSIKARTEALDEHEDMQDEGVSLALLRAIKAIIYNFQSQEYRALAIHEGMHHFFYGLS
jgi:hypothetical protein